MDNLFGMERYHLTKVRKKFKDIKDKLKDKMYTLKQFNGANDFNIPDPYLTGLENYNRILKIVDENVELLIKNIIKINKSTL